MWLLINRNIFMTAITKAQIPNDCNSVEKLAAWALITLARLNPTLKILELDNESPIVASSVSILKASGGENRLLARFSLELNADYEVSPEPIWELVKDLSNTAIPAGYFQV